MSKKIHIEVNYEGSTIEDIEAYRDLQNEPFDFGTGLIYVDSKESEDVYYKIYLNALYDQLEDLCYHFDDEVSRNKHHPKEAGRRKRLNSRRYKKHLQKLKDREWFLAYEKERDGKVYIKRCYCGSSYFKNQGNKKVRRYKYKLSKGGQYKKCYGYWNQIF